jgi:hypothetical protein
MYNKIKYALTITQHRVFSNAYLLFFLLYADMIPVNNLEFVMTKKSNPI